VLELAQAAGQPVALVLEGARQRDDGLDEAPFVLVGAGRLCGGARVAGAGGVES
jgi:hypothetical protein